MTRKRFKKLLMARGISRNEADALAWSVMSLNAQAGRLRRQPKKEAGENDN